MEQSLNVWGFISLITLLCLLQVCFPVCFSSLSPQVWWACCELAILGHGGEERRQMSRTYMVQVSLRLMHKSSFKWPIFRNHLCLWTKEWIHHFIRFQDSMWCQLELPFNGFRQIYLHSASCAVKKATIWNPTTVTCDFHVMCNKFRENPICKNLKDVIVLISQLSSSALHSAQCAHSHFPQSFTRT